MKKYISYYLSVIVSEIKMLKSGLAYVLTAKKKAMYVGCTRMGNLGDEAIFRAIKLLVGNELFLYEIPYSGPSKGGYFRKFFFKSPNYIILGGGTIIRKQKNESYLRILDKLCAKYPKAKIVVLGPGVANPEFANYIGFPVAIPEWTNLLNTTDFIGVRGKLSKQELIAWGVSKPINIFHDPAVYFAKSSIKKRKRNKIIGVNFADIGNRIYGKNKQVIEEFAIDIVGKLINSGWTVYLYPTTKSDLEYMYNTIGLKKFEEVLIYKNYKDLKSSLEFLESLDVFLGQRLHSIIFASCVYTPFYALEYEPKTSDFLNTLGLEGYVSRVDQLDVNSIFGEINTQYSDLEAKQQELFEKLTNAKLQQQELSKKFLSKL